MLWTIIIFLILFTIIALVHEGGHCFAAKKAGMHVLEFGIGFGPRLWATKIGDTEYSINAIPILAFVSIAGMDDDNKQRAHTGKGLYFQASPLGRFMMAFSGPLSNVILSFLVLCILFSLTGVPKGVSNTIGQVQANSVAAKSGLLANDQVIEFNGAKVADMASVIDDIHKNKGKEISLKVKRGDKEITIKATPKYNERMKVSLLGFSPLPIYEKTNILQSIYYSFKQTIGMVVLMFVIIWQLIIGAISVRELAGPVGIAQITGNYANAGLVSLVSFFAFLNVNIGVLNLLPLPALDGGHIVFALIEMITKKRVKEDLQQKIHQWGMMVLLGLMFLVTINDVIRLFRPQ